MAESETMNSTGEVMQSEMNSSKAGETNNESDSFKVPVFAAPLKLKSPVSQPEKLKTEDTITIVKESSETKPEPPRKSSDKFISAAEKLKQSSTPIPYKEPAWSGLPSVSYRLETLKNGTILSDSSLNEKPYIVFGRQRDCDVMLEHPSISRYHGVLQYKSSEEGSQSKGFYLFDLESTHGTFLNKRQVKSRVYCPVRVGHFFKFGGSSRTFIVQGPEDDAEPESDLTATELVEQRKEKEKALKKQMMKEEKEKLKKQEETESEGINWGMGDDAEEESDLAENPFATETCENEELYINDPKKTLRGWFEREGYELEYKVEDRGIGQFQCRIELPIDSSAGGSVVAEVDAKAKKKEVVAQCALEACRILDRYGLLRQSTHESRKRKSKQWEDDDFYDSDEDPFLDRTGSLEKKREQRKVHSGKETKGKAETYEGLLSQLADVEKELSELSDQIVQFNSRQDSQTVADEDDLDSYMLNLNSAGKTDKNHLREMKRRQVLLDTEKQRITKLINIAKPAALPALEVPQKMSLPLFGAMKCKKRKENSSKPISDSDTSASAQVDEVEIDSDEEVENGLRRTTENTLHQQSSAEAETDPSLPKQVAGTPVEAKSESSVVKSTNTLEKTASTSSSVSQSPSGVSFKMSSVSKLGATLSSSQRKRLIKEQKEPKKPAKELKVEYDASDPDYTLWMPPQGQSGDGSTNLNAKYGY